MLINKRLILAHFWLAFAVFGARAGARRLADVRAQPAERLALQSGILLSLGHRARLGRWATCFRPWSRWALATPSPKSALEKPLIGRRWAWAGFWLVAVGAVVAMVPVSLGLGVGALHLLSADGRQSLLLHRRRHGRGRLMDLGRADVDQSGGLEARQSRQAGAAGDVRQCRGLLSLGLDRGRRRARNHFPDPAGGARPARRPSTPGWRACSSPGRCMRSSISG